MKIILKICALVFVLIINDTSHCLGQENNKNAALNISAERISAKKCHEYALAVFEKIPHANINVKSTKMISQDLCKMEPQPLFENDYIANQGEFPHMAIIGTDQSNKTTKETTWVCGGTLISDRYVLTAAHCAFSRLGPLKYVRIGDTNLKLVNDDNDAVAEILNITEVIIHPEFKCENAYNDIALLKLHRSVIFNKHKRPACLPSYSQTITGKVIGTGWGKTGWTYNADKLKRVTLNIVSESDCDNVFKNYANRNLNRGIEHKTQICAEPTYENKDMCEGDRGGPIQIYHASEYCMYEIVGITSFGITCGMIEVPSIYTRVFPFVEWIENTIWN